MGNKAFLLSFLVHLSFAFHYGDFTLAGPVLLCLHFHIYIHLCFNFAWVFLVLKRKEYIRVLSSTSMQMFPLKLHTVILQCKGRSQPPPSSLHFDWCLSQTSLGFLVMQNTPPHCTAFHRTHARSLQTQKPGNRN